MKKIETLLNIALDKSADNLYISLSFLSKGIYEVTIQGRTTEGNYPAYRSVIPKNNNIKATYEVKPLLKVLDKADTVANSTTRKGDFIINGNTKVVAIDEDFKREYTGHINSEHTGDQINISFNLYFLSEVLKDLRNDKVTIEIENNTRGVLIREKNTLVLLMPVMRA